MGLGTSLLMATDKVTLVSSSQFLQLRWPKKSLRSCLLGNKMCCSVGASVTEPASAFGSHQNQTMMTLECAKCKDSHFKVRNKDRPGLQYSGVSVWNLVDHVKTESRLGPLGLLDWGEAGISYVGQVRHSDRCPKTCIWKGQMERKLVLKLGRDDTCAGEKNKDTYTLKLS